MAEDAPNFDFALDPAAMSNCNESDVGADFLADAEAAAEERRKQGYDAQGRLGGEFNERNPPPGKLFDGYHKGCTGITWRDAEPSQKK